MGQGDNDDALRNLGERLDKARRATGRPGPSNAAPDSRGGKALAAGLRIGLELIVAVFVGVGLGWAFDKWLGTGPWGLIVFLFLGFGAGVANIFRFALGMERAVGYAPPKGEPPKAVGWSDDDED
jgi:ATP synthase protein I